ncbi:MAG: hypothetical protein JXA21_27855 [Anaerolineae bacterium]|nr:hypothetical protein [Anaerolineae bacterium]
MMPLALYATNPTDGITRRILDATGLQWFSGYTAEGSGFGYLSFNLPRRTGRDYADLGYAYRLVLRKGPFRVLFDGLVVRVTERRGAEEGFEVWCLGWLHVASFDAFNRIYCDGRYSEWRSSEQADGTFQPARFDWQSGDNLYFKPRRGEHIPYDYTYLRYAFPFGETAARFTANYTLALPEGFPGKAEIRAGNTVLWAATTTGSGTLNLTPSGAATTFEVRFYVMMDSLIVEGEEILPEVTAEDETVYFKLENVKVYSVNVSTLDAKVIADDVAASLTAHGLDASTERIAASGSALEQAAFDGDQTFGEVLTWLCQFGDAENKALIWGVCFDNTRRLFLESQSAVVRYIVERDRAQLERGGDWSESAQVVYGVVGNTNGTVTRTADFSDAGAIARLGGQYRRQPLQLSEVTPGQADHALALYLKEHSGPTMSGSIVVAGGVRTPEGRFVPFDEVLPGGYV